MAIDWMEELVGVFCDPIIVYPSAWADMLPDDLKQAITMDRLIMLMKANKSNEDPTATDAECCAYLYPASLEAPIDHDWAQIYLYVSTQYLQAHRQMEVPDDIRVNELSRDQERQLKDLRRWLYQAKVKHRARRRQESKAQEKERKEAIIEEECPQLVLF